MVYTEEEITLADDMSLSYVVSRMGYAVQRIGRHFTVKEMDSFGYITTVLGAGAVIEAIMVKSAVGCWTS